MIANLSNGPQPEFSLTDSYIILSFNVNLLTLCINWQLKNIWHQKAIRSIYQLRVQNFKGCVANIKWPFSQAHQPKPEFFIVM